LIADSSSPTDDGFITTTTTDPLLEETPDSGSVSTIIEEEEEVLAVASSLDGGSTTDADGFSPDVAGSGTGSDPPDPFQSRIDELEADVERARNFYDEDSDRGIFDSVAVRLALAVVKYEYLLAEAFKNQVNASLDEDLRQLNDRVEDAESQLEFGIDPLRTELRDYATQNAEIKEILDEAQAGWEEAKSTAEAWITYTNEDKDWVSLLWDGRATNREDYPGAFYLRSQARKEGVSHQEIIGYADQIQAIGMEIEMYTGEEMWDPEIDGSSAVREAVKEVFLTEIQELFDRGRPLADDEIDRLSDAIGQFNITIPWIFSRTDPSAQFPNGLGSGGGSEAEDYMRLIGDFRAALGTPDWYPNGINLQEYVDRWTRWKDVLEDRKEKARGSDAEWFFWRRNYFPVDDDDAPDLGEDPSIADFIKTLEDAKDAVEDPPGKLFDSEIGLSWRPTSTVLEDLYYNFVTWSLGLKNLD